MRSATSNPFNPGSDVVPQVWAGRTVQLNDWRDFLRPRLTAGLPERGRTILGEPGLGKSALVRKIAAVAAAGGDWVTPQIRVPLGSDPLKLLAAALLKLAHAAGLATGREQTLKTMLGRVESVAASGVSVGLREGDGQDPHTTLTELLVEIGHAARRQGVVCLIHIDEVQNITDERALSQLLIALGDAITHRTAVEAPGGVQVEVSLPIAVYLTGLPEFEDRAGAHQGATFARRFATTVLAAISEDDLAAALQEFVIPGWQVPDDHGGVLAVHMTQDAVATLIDVCRGEPFLLQLAGERAWYASGDAVITTDQVKAGWSTAQREAAAHVERILERLPPRERDFLAAMAELPPADRTFKQIAARAGVSPDTKAGPTSQRLDTVRGIIARGKPYSFQHRAVEAYLTSSWPAFE